jgi:hypothetical protein
MLGKILNPSAGDVLISFIPNSSFLFLIFISMAFEYHSERTFTIGGKVILKGDGEKLFLLA